MILTISPAKTLDIEHAPLPKNSTQPFFIKQADYLVNKLKKYPLKKLKSMMDISQGLAELNFERYQSWELPFTPEKAKEALYIFKGEVYRGIDVNNLNEQAKNYLMKQLLILSGLYGVLRSSDLVLPYRLEMGSKFNVTPKNTNLYKFWGDQITDFFNAKLEEENTSTLINLASKEYFKSINIKKLKADIITPEFKDEKNGTYKMISIFAKKARGLMVRFIAENNISNPNDIRAFDSEGYYFNNNLSNSKKWVFTRDH